MPRRKRRQASIEPGPCHAAPIDAYRRDDMPASIQGRQLHFSGRDGWNLHDAIHKSHRHDYAGLLPARHFCTLLLFHDTYDVDIMHI